MKTLSTFFYDTGAKQGICIDQPATSGRILCVRASAYWSAKRPTGHELRSYAAGGASAIAL